MIVSISIAKRCPRSRVFSCEPLPQSRELFQENMRLNDVSNIEILPVAVGAEHRRVSVALDDKGEPGDFSLVSSDETSTGDLEIEFIPFEEVIEACGGSCDFVKIDCEGGEFEIVLKSSDQALRSVRHFAMEYHDFEGSEFSHNDLVVRLQELGFSVNTKANPVHKHLGFLFATRKD